MLGFEKRCACVCWGLRRGVCVLRFGIGVYMLCLCMCTIKMTQHPCSARFTYPICLMRWLPFSLYICLSISPFSLSPPFSPHSFPPFLLFSLSLSLSLPLCDVALWQGFAASATCSLFMTKQGGRRRGKRGRDKEERGRVSERERD